jgi:hypothetical protein
MDKFVFGTVTVPDGQHYPLHLPLLVVLLRTGMGDQHVRQVKGE